MQRPRKPTLKAIADRKCGIAPFIDFAVFGSVVRLQGLASDSDALSSGVTMLRTVLPDEALFWTVGEMAARQCPGFRSYVTIEYSEIWAIVGIAFDGVRACGPAMSMRGITGGRAAASPTASIVFIAIFSIVAATCRWPAIPTTTTGAS
jgi:hypothetical protein